MDFPLNSSWSFFYSSPNLALKFRGLLRDWFQEWDPLLAPHRDVSVVFRVKSFQEALKTIDNITQSVRVLVGQNGLDGVQPLGHRHLESILHGVK
jgi:hypothetical protein